MALEAAFEYLWTRLHRLRDAAHDLDRVAVRPSAPVIPRAVDQFREGVTELVAGTEEAIAASARAREAVYPLDLDRARRALAGCQGAFRVAAHVLREKLASHDRLQELGRLGSGRAPEAAQWRRWMRAVAQTVEQCRHAFDEVDGALFACWNELIEKSGTTSISINAMNVGQVHGLATDTPAAASDARAGS